MGVDMPHDEKVLTMKVVMWVVGTLMVAWGTAYGYTWIRLGSVEAKTESARIENVGVQAQLSQIQTDLKWVINALEKGK
jgi:hypothetical protein